MRGLRLNGGIAKGKRKRFAAIPICPLIVVVLTQWVAGLAHHEIFSRRVGITPVDGETLRRAEGTSGCIHGGCVSTMRVPTGAGPLSDPGDVAVERMPDVDRVSIAIVPGFQHKRCGVQTFLYDGGEEVVPRGISAGEPARGIVSDELLSREIALGPVIQSPFVSQLWTEQHGPKSGLSSSGDGSGGGVRAYGSIPRAHEVCGLTQANVSG